MPKSTWQEVFPDASLPPNEDAAAVSAAGAEGVCEGSDEDSEEDSDFDPDDKGGDAEEADVRGDAEEASDAEEDRSSSEDSSGSDESGSDESSEAGSVHASELDALSDVADLSDSDRGGEEPWRRSKRRRRDPLAPSAALKGRKGGRGYVLVSESESDDEAAAVKSKPKLDDGTLDEANILPGKRRRKVHTAL